MMKGKLLVVCLLLARTCQSVRADKKEDHNLKNLFFKANLVVASKMVFLNRDISMIQSQGQQIYFLNFREYQVLKGKQIYSKKVSVEVVRNTWKKETLPTFYPGKKYVLFLRATGYYPQWQLAGAQLYSADRAQRIQAFRFQLMARTQTRKTSKVALEANPR